MKLTLRQQPVLCNYYLTYRCNAKCSFCDIWEKPSPYVTLENVEQNLKDLKRLGVKVIDFTGGEPLLHRQLPEILDLAKSLGFITTVTTNTSTFILTNTFTITFTHAFTFTLTNTFTRVLTITCTHLHIHTYQHIHTRKLTITSTHTFA